MSFKRKLTLYKSEITEGRFLNPSAKIGLFEHRFIPSLEPERSQIFPTESVFVPIKAVTKSGPPQKTGIFSVESIWNFAKISFLKKPELNPMGTKSGSNL